MKPATTCIFSVDVEDWFHILELQSAPPVAAWDWLPSRVERNLMRLFEIFSEANTHVTCFFLGWVAQKFPHLVREAAQRGHEIASHGHYHRLVHQMTRSEFLNDAVSSKKLLEDTVGHPVAGYRASGFSVTGKTPWFFSALVEAGYRYDSSTFPARRAHGGVKGGRLAPYVVSDHCGRLVEFPITVSRFAGTPLCFFGGGYLRLFPLPVIRRMALRVLAEGRPVIFYVHPREIDLDHPRLAMSLTRRFKCYINLKTTEGKIKGLLSEFPMSSFADWISNSAHGWSEAPQPSGAGL